MKVGRFLATYTRRPTSLTTLSSSRQISLVSSTRARQWQRSYEWPEWPQLVTPSHVQSRCASTNRRNDRDPNTWISLSFVMLIGAAIAAAFWFDSVPFKVKFTSDDGSPSVSGKPAPEDATKTALTRELIRYLTQIQYYYDKDLEAACEAFEKTFRFVEQHPDIGLQSFALTMRLQRDYVYLLAYHKIYTECLRQINMQIDFCKRKLEEYDQRGILNLPLERDLLAFAVPRPRTEGAKDMKLYIGDLTETEQRKSVFQTLFEAYDQLITLYLPNDSPMKDNIRAKETIENMLSALEAEFGPSFERAPAQARADMVEVDKVTIINILSRLRNHFVPNISPEYSPELVLQLSRPLSELLSSLESSHGIPPCLRICILQSIADMVLDLACESAPKGFLTTHEDRLHLEEARRVQQRVLQLAADVDPTKRDKRCDQACFNGLVSMAKIAWRCGDEKTGDQELEKATRLADSMNNALCREVIKRMDKDPSTTPMKYWEPVSKEENERLWALDVANDREATEQVNDAASKRE